MIKFEVRAWGEAELQPRENELAWKIAEYAVSRPTIDNDTTEMVRCRVVDNAAVALAAINREAVRSARAMALAHPRNHGATIIGLPSQITVHAEWAAWANACAVRELDFHDTFLAADFGHPGDNIPPLVAVAQQTGKNGRDLIRAIAIAYEVHVALIKGICLHRHKKDHVAHLLPATVAGIGALLDLPMEIVYHAINQVVHLGFSTRQSRKGEISSWKAYVPAYSGKTAVEAVDRAMRGEGAPNPIYEGTDSVIAWMLDGPRGQYTVPFPDPGEPPRGILETYTKAYSAEYQAQALIDLAFETRERVDLNRIKKIIFHTSNHTHVVIGTGSGDRQKFDPKASRETLDHSAMYILAVALHNGRWHHNDSYSAACTKHSEILELWKKIETREDPYWEERYHHQNPTKRAFGGRLEVFLDDGSVIELEKDVANAHPCGTNPWTWNNYLTKFDTLTAGSITPLERDRFVNAISNFGNLNSEGIKGLNPILPSDIILDKAHVSHGIFDWPPP